jgi:hypothetical protein
MKIEDTNRDPREMDQKLRELFFPVGDPTPLI